MIIFRTRTTVRQRRSLKNIAGYYSFAHHPGPIIIIETKETLISLQDVLPVLFIAHEADNDQLGGFFQTSFLATME